MKWQAAAGHNGARTIWIAGALAVVLAVAAIVLLVRQESGTHQATGPGDTAGVGTDKSGLKLVTGPLTIDHDNTRVSDLHVTDSLYITGSDVTVTNVVVDGDIYVNQTVTGAMRSPVPKHIQLSRVDAQTIWTNGFDDLSVSRCRFQASVNSPNAQLFSYHDESKNIEYPASNLLIEDSAFLGVSGSTDAAHLENIHLGGVQGATLQRNTFSITAAAGSATLANITANVVLEPALYGTPNRDVRLVANRFTGGGFYQLYFIAAGTAVVDDNAFSSSGPNFKAVQYPPSAYSAAQLAGATTYPSFRQQGNTLDGSPTQLPGGA